MSWKACPFWGYGVGNAVLVSIRKQCSERAGEGQEALFDHRSAFDLAAKIDYWIEIQNSGSQRETAIEPSLRDATIKHRRSVSKRLHQTHAGKAREQFVHSSQIKNAAGAFVTVLWQWLFRAGECASAQISTR